MFDFRGCKEVIKEAVARERRSDQNWTWKIHSINRNCVKIAWGYMEYVGETDAFFKVMVIEDDDMGCWVEGIAPDGFRVIRFIGDTEWDDFRMVEEGIASAIHGLAQHAHLVY